MFNRTNKLTALLVAAATVVATAVPASAAERLGSKEGNLTTAYSYAEGKYVYDGYLDDDDDTAVYFNDGDEATEVEDYDDYDMGGDSSEKYGTKYVTVKDGSDTYLLDLSTGKIDDSESVEDKKDNLASKLKTALKKADRYENTKKENEDPTLTRVLANKYGEVWYKYEALGDADAETAMDNGTSYIGFVNEDGDYIDASSLANIYVYSELKGKTVKFEKFGDEEELGKDGDTTVNGTLVLKDIEVVAQDEDYLYAITTVTVDGLESGEQQFFQKISKEQGDKEDGAYTPKSVASYQIDNKTIYDDGDMNDAYEALKKADNITVKDSVVYVNTYDDEDTVKMYGLKLKKDKIDTISGKSNVDAYVVKKDSDDDEDITTLNDANPVSYDVDGNAWILGKGKIYKFEDGEYKEKYTCDRSINNLDVYDDENLIAWDSEGDVFTVLQGGKKATEEVGNTTDGTDGTTTDGTATDGTTTDGTATDGTVTADKAGWDKNADGTWSYYKDGAAVKGQWVQDGNWYYLDANGIMATGWVQDGNWYYMNQSGAMMTGWVNDNGTWYYMNQSGAMLANTTVDGYVLGANGAWIQ